MDSTMDLEVAASRRIPVTASLSSLTQSTSTLVSMSSTAHLNAKARRHTAQRANEADDQEDEVRFGEGDDDGNPKHWPIRRRVALTFLCWVLTLITGYAASAASTALDLFVEEYQVSMVASELVTTLYLLSYASAPFIWAPLSELFGRRYIFVVTLLVFTIFSMANALAPNFGSILTFRFLAGFFAAAPLSNCGGVVSDLFTSRGRGPAMSLYATSILGGPTVGPAFAGIIVQNTMNWRNVLWLQTALAGLALIITALFLPETYAPTLLQRRAQRLRKADPEKYGRIWASLERREKSPKAMFQHTVVKPVRMVLCEPILQVVTAWQVMVNSLLYATLSIYPLVFMDLRGFNAGQSGVVFLGTGLGAVLGGIANVFIPPGYHDFSRRWKGSPPPEQRLRGAMIGAILLVLSLLFFGWTAAYARISWSIPFVATILIGASFSLVFLPLQVYVLDVYLGDSASALAVNTICRSLFAAAIPLFTTQMFMGMGIQWASTLLACIGILLAPSPFLLYKYGDRIRARSKWAPNTDLALRGEVREDEKREQEATRRG